MISLLLGLSTVGQIFFAPDPHEALTAGHPLLELDPGARAWKVPHHTVRMQTQTQTQSRATTAADAAENYDDILGAVKPNNYDEVLGVSSVDYETAFATERETEAIISNTNTNTTNNNTTNNTTNNNDPDPLVVILQAAGLNISDSDRASLPTWSSMTQQYGPSLSSGPLIVGMETCERYRQQVPAARRYVGPAGMFNTGTNAAAFHVQRNLNVNWKWQVPWGKVRYIYIGIPLLSIDSADDIDSASQAKSRAPLTLVPCRSQPS